MKKIFSVMILAVAGIAITNAKEVNILNDVNRMEIVQEVAVQDSVKRTLMQPQDLPDAVKNTLGGEEFVDWKITTAYFVEPEEMVAFYEVSLQREGEEDIRVVKLNANGEIIS